MRLGLLGSVVAGVRNDAYLASETRAAETGQQPVARKGLTLI
ncbi:hypothetical protein P3T17_000439 [Paraburkholderia sp. GAS82]